MFIDFDYDYYGYGDYRGGYNEPFYRYDEFYFDYAGPPQPSAVRQPPNRPQPVGPNTHSLLITYLLVTSRRTHHRSIVFLICQIIIHIVFLLLIIWVDSRSSNGVSDSVKTVVCRPDRGDGRRSLGRGRLSAAHHQVYRARLEAPTNTPRLTCAVVSVAISRLHCLASFRRACHLPHPPSCSASLGSIPTNARTARARARVMFSRCCNEVANMLKTNWPAW